MAAPLDGSLVVLTPSLSYVQLDAMGAEIWDSLDVTNQEAEIAAILAQRYEVTVQEALTDIQRFIDRLAALGAIEVKPLTGH